jgi:N-acetylglucosaminyl-diphospho-decaprenol L-rhamnosyltransferase
MSATCDVVIVAYDSRDRLGGCLATARRLADVGEVVVVDHGQDGSADLAREAGVGALEDPSNPGFGAGQNRGVRATSAPYVLLLNPDAEPAPSGVAAGMALLERDPSVAATQGVIIDRASGAPQRSAGRELGPWHLLGRVVGARRLLGVAPVRRVAARLRTTADHVDRVPASPTSVESLAATALLVRRAAFVDVGGFDERYFLYGEDLDLSRRWRAAGWRLVALPDRFAVHDGGASSGRWAARELAWWGGTMRFAACWWGNGPWRAARGAATLQWLKLTLREPHLARPAWQALLREPRTVRRAAATRPDGSRATGQSTAVV